MPGFWDICHTTQRQTQRERQRQRRSQRHIKRSPASVHLSYPAVDPTTPDQPSPLLENIFNPNIWMDHNIETTPAQPSPLLSKTHYIWMAFTWVDHYVNLTLSENFLNSTDQNLVSRPSLQSKLFSTDPCMYYVPTTEAEGQTGC